MTGFFVRITLCLLLAFSSGSTLIGATPQDVQQPEQQQAHYEIDWTDTRSRGEATEWRTRYKNVRGFPPRPEQAVIDQLVVEWETPSLDGLGNFCQLRGTLRVPTEQPGELRPVDWFEGITVLVAMHSGETPDWSNGFDEKDTLVDLNLVGQSGQFEITIELSELGKDRSQAQSYQVGIALCRHAGSPATQQLTWSSAQPAVAASVRMLEIPAAPVISRELELLNAARAWPDGECDTAAFIRAVNALQAVGKEQALATLEEWERLTTLRDESNYEYFEERNLSFWVIRALFEPIDPSERIPVPLIAVVLTNPDDPGRQNWPLDPMAVVNGVPFMVGHAVGLGGQEESSAAHILWAREHGVVRDAPLQPTTDPLTAAQVILGSRQFQQLEPYPQERAIHNLRTAVLGMVRELLPELSAEDLYSAAYGNDDDAWQAIANKITALEIRWDPELQKFTAHQDK